MEKQIVAQRFFRHCAVCTFHNLSLFLFYNIFVRSVFFCVFSIGAHRAQEVNKREERKEREKIAAAKYDSTNEQQK